MLRARNAQRAENQFIKISQKKKQNRIIVLQFNGTKKRKEI